MNNRTTFGLSMALCVIFPSVAPAAIVTSGGGLTLVETGGTFAAGNLATAAGPTAAFAPNIEGQDGGVSPQFTGYVGVHTTTGVNNGVYGNTGAWLAGSPGSYIGLNLGNNFSINSIAYGRDNNGAFGDRQLGLVTLEYTNSVTPGLTSTWTTVGTMNYTGAGIDFGNADRHRFDLTPVNATGVRLVMQNSGRGIDEFEVYGTAISPPVPQSGLRSWVKADGDVTTSGALITRMGDHSFNGNHATPGISPDLATNAINGLPAARFDAPVEHLNLPTATGLSNSDYEIFVIAKSSSSNIQFLTAGESGGVGNYELHLNGAAGARFIPSTSATPSPDTLADIGVSGMFTDGRARLFNTRVEGGIGKLRAVGMENGDTVANATSSFVGRLTLGVRGDATLSFAGDMGEVVVYNRALNATERRQVEQHLAYKWNAPLNVASQTQGGIAFANELIAGGGFSAHQINHLNDAKYGNPFSWIGNDNGGANAFAGVKFDDAYNISSLAYGRSATGDLADRDAGTYTFQYTLDNFNPSSPASINAATWTTFLTQVITDSATSHLRHQYDFATILGARGVRVLVSNNSIAIDELEIYGVVPEPSSVLMLALGGLVLLGMRRR